MKTYQEHEYWEDANYLRWNRAKLSISNLSNADLEALCQLGIPTWVAPNINLDILEIEDKTLKLGEDREDRSINLSMENGRVFVGGTEQYINRNVEVFRKSLQAYAVMVERAIEIDSEAIIKNNIDETLVREFRSQIFAIDEKATQDGSYWNEEIRRLLKHII